MVSNGRGSGSLHNWRDMAAGVFFVAVGFVVATVARSYAIGEPSNPGPGFFPFCLGVLLVLLGVIIATVAIVNGPLDEEGHTMKPRAVIGILGPVVIFGLILAPVGFVLSTIVLVMLSSAASRSFDWRRSLLAAVILAAIVLVGFAYILQIQIPVWPSFLYSGNG